MSEPMLQLKGVDAAYGPFRALFGVDLTVPAGMGGLEAAQQLRAMDPNVRVLVSSGYAGDPVLRDFREHGFLGMLTKPFCLGDLASELGRVLEGPPVRP